jgi:hypothetical protein
MSIVAEFRGRILEVLELISNDRAQLEYSRIAPHVDVPAELFNQWDDSYHPDELEFCHRFSSAELAAVATFDALANLIADETPQQLPPLGEFMKTSAWRQLSAGAARTLEEMNLTWRNGLLPPPTSL